MVEKYKPFVNIGPGEFIKEELEERNWTQEDLAAILGLSAKSINKLINNKQAITTEVARLLSSAFGQSPQYWMNLDTNYRLRLLGEKEDREHEVGIKANIYTHMPIKEMMNYGWIRCSNDAKNLTNVVKKFWGRNELDFAFLDANAAAFRKSYAFPQFNTNYALTWLRMANICSTLYKVPKYNKQGLKQLVAHLSEYTNSGDGVAKFIQALNGIGIKFFVLRHLSKTYIDGASFLDKETPVIVYTKRHDRTDNFWFTIAHEIGHVTKHLKDDKDIFIDDLSRNVVEASRDEREKEANEFAEQKLRVKEILGHFAHHRRYITRARVETCANYLRISPAIVVGILQHHGFLSRTNLNRFKTRVSDLIPETFWAERGASEDPEVAYSS